MRLIAQFGGLAPRTSEHLKDGQAADVALDVKLDSGRLSAWRERLTVSAVNPDSRSFHAWGCFSYGWPTCVRAADYLPDPAKLYLTGRQPYPEFMTTLGGQPAYHRLGLPAPARPLAVAAATADGEDCDARSYVYTYVNRWEEESAPSPPSATITVRDGAAVSLAGFAPPPAGYEVVELRLYRTATAWRTGDEREQTPATEYLQCASLPLGTSSYQDQILIRRLGEALTTVENLPPPDNLRLISHINGTGLLVGATVNQVHFSENFQPGNWPEADSLTLPRRIINLGTLDTNVFVTTEGQTFVIDGSTQCEERQERRVTDCDTALPDLGGGWPRSAVITPFGMIYSSRAGLTLVKPDATFEVVTRSWYNADEWSRLRPETCRLAWWRGRVVCVTEAISFLLELDGETYGDFRPGALTTISDRPDDLEVTPNGELLMLENGQITQFDAGGTRRPYRWVSRRFLQAETRPTAARLRSEDGVNLRILSDWDEVVYERRVRGEEVFRLGRIGRSRGWRLELSGTGEVELAKVAADMNELTGEI